MDARASEVSAAERTSGPRILNRPSETRSSSSRTLSRRGPSRIERRLVHRLLSALPELPLAVVLWNGEELRACPKPARYRVRPADRGALWRLVSDPLYQFGELYSEKRLEFEGDLVELLVAVEHALRDSSHRLLNSPLSQLLHRPRRNTLSGSRRHIHHHYDISNDFYRLWLDEQLVYTCAYFSEPEMKLEAAQIAKLDHVCRKMLLRPGQAVIEAGCGWGALAIHMARNYGVTVRAFNISHEQVAYARKRARHEGLDGRVEFVEDDWRNITGRCEAFVSVGMLEHVGPQNYEELGNVIHRCLMPHGLGLIHTIGRNRPRLVTPWIERRIFPGGQPPSLGQMMAIFESHDFSVLDVENLRLHYAETLRHWLLRFDRAEDSIRAMLDERFVRTWRLYLAGSVAAFESGGMQLFQVVFAHGRNNMLPRSRAELYGAGRVPLFAEDGAREAC